MVDADNLELNNSFIAIHGIPGSFADSNAAVATDREVGEDLEVNADGEEAENSRREDAAFIDRLNHINAEAEAAFRAREARRAAILVRSRMKRVQGILLGMVGGAGLMIQNGVSN